jgi:multicomponent K+:H+ antiporter subunit G
MTELNLPMWAALPAGVLLIVGGLIVLVGAIGLVRLPDTFSRMHPPTMGATLGAGCILIASMLVSTAFHGRPVVHEFLITVFLAITAPISAMILTRAVMYRMRRKEMARAALRPEARGQ